MGFCALPSPKTFCHISPMRRWFLRILIGLLALLLTAAIGLQVVFRTDLPRTLVLKEVQSALQLRVEAKSLTTGWGGHTVLQDVKLSLPLETQSFLTVKTLRVNHTQLLGILLTRGVKVRGLEF